MVHSSTKTHSPSLSLRMRHLRRRCPWSSCSARRACAPRGACPRSRRSTSQPHASFRDRPSPRLSRAGAHARSTATRGTDVARMEAPPRYLANLYDTLSLTMSSSAPVAAAVNLVFEPSTIPGYSNSKLSTRFSVVCPEAPVRGEWSFLIIRASLVCIYLQGSLFALAVMSCLNDSQIGP
ncbi:hypothetical protein FA95DRAFT_87702 [Auriscalpium vulgare]|uniref:Uncharacterized protein n=1 Tax=Auriscalpium vulgare TaxID=40419 RepID=A0ACB8RNM4_9AGAM|nr:hypothetical protein FA95DRAFT_87702 [Auriscalpium vulgare]